MSTRRRFGALGLGMGMGGGGGVVIDPDAQIHIDRVLADGGTVEDVAYLNNTILNAKFNTKVPWWDDVKTAYSTSWGYKIGTDIEKLYSLKGAAFDIVRTNVTRQPDLIPNGRNGKSIVRFDIAKFSFFDPKAFAILQPATVVMVGVSLRSQTDGARLFDGFTNVNTSAWQSSAANSLSAYAGSSSTHTRKILNEFDMLRFTFAGVNGASLVNEAAGILAFDFGTNDMDGLTLGANGGVGLPVDMDLGAHIILNSAVDANQIVKMGVIRDYFAPIYNTPWGGFGAKGSITYGLIGDSIATDPAIFTNNDQTAAITLDNTGGVGGDTLAQIDTRTAPYVAGVPQSKTWVIGGANDFVAAASDPNASAQASIQSITNKIVAGGSVPILSTMQPFGNHASWTAQRQTWTDTYDAWIIAFAATNGWDYVDMVATLSDDNLTLKAAFDSGDGLHPNSQGSFAMDDAFNLLIR